MRMDRTKLQIGTYCYGEKLWNDTDMAKLAAAGINYIASTSQKLAELAERHNIGLLVSGLPGWYGGEGDNAGQLASKVKPEDYDAVAAKFVDSPAFWALDVGDEPNAADFEHYGKLVAHAQKLFPEHLIYLNLYPNYASEKQLGTKTYEEHIRTYAKYVPTDYICFDHYMYAVGIDKLLENLRIVSDVCRETGRDMWTVLEVSDLKILLNQRQMRLQAGVALAYGTRSINWACWSAGWYVPDLQVVDSNGNYTSMYGDLCGVNAELAAFSPVYMSYKNTGAFVFGDTSDKFFTYDAVKNAVPPADFAFSGFASPDGGSAVAGCFSGKAGQALLIANASDPMGAGTASHTFTFSAPDGARAYVNGSPAELVRSAGGYSIELADCSYAFITL